ncbi:MAG: right-handed parallel beta-helix repeat-containing protein [Candidatus Babeliales bacterium]
MKKFLVIFIFFNCYSWLSAMSIADRITSPGVYRYRSNIFANPTIVNDTIISIEVSRVILDLAGYTLDQASSNMIGGLTGITIQSNIEDVEIINGAVIGLTGNGIQVGDGCRNIRIKNITVDSCDAGGILFDGSSSGTGIDKISIEQVTILSCTGANSNPAFGIKLEQSQNFQIKNSILCQNDANTIASGYGVWITSSTFGSVEGCIARENGGNEIGAGFFIETSDNVVLQNSRAFHTIARSANASSLSAGFRSLQSNSILFEENQSIQNTHLQQKALGFSAQSSSSNIFKRCIAQMNTGATEAAGFEIVAEDNPSITQSVSSGNQTTSSGTAYGIHFLGSLNNNGYIIENDIMNNIGVSSSFGIVDDRNPSTTLFIRNRAFNNGTNYSITYPIGITLPTIIGSLSNSVIALPSLSAGDLDNLDLSP